MAFNTPWLISNYCQGHKNVGLYSHSPIHLHGIVLFSEVQGQFYFFLHSAHNNNYNILYTPCRNILTFAVTGCDLFQLIWLVFIQIFKSHKERSPLSLMSTIEELLERKSSDSGLEKRDYGHRGSAVLTTWHPSIHKSWQ
jgi:hypothetical protein